MSIFKRRSGHGFDSRPDAEQKRLQLDADARVMELEQGGIAPKPTFIFPSPVDPTSCTGSACSPEPIGCIGVECFDPNFPNNPRRTLWTKAGVE